MDDPSGSSVVVVLGRQYTADGPLLFFATQTALVRGWDVWSRCVERRPRQMRACQRSRLGEQQLDASVGGYRAAETNSASDST